MPIRNCSCPIGCDHEKVGIPMHYIDTDVHTQYCERQTLDWKHSVIYVYSLLVKLNHLKRRFY